MCMIDYSDGPCEILREKHQRARKPHKCTECYRVIEPGETYLYESLKYEGEVSTSKTCAHCQVVRDWLATECGGWVYTAVEEDLHEHVTEGGYPMGLTRAYVSMKNDWRTRKGGLRPVPTLDQFLSSPPTREENPNENLHQA